MLEFFVCLFLFLSLFSFGDVLFSVDKMFNSWDRFELIGSDFRKIYFDI